MRVWRVPFGPIWWNTLSITLVDRDLDKDPPSEPTGAYVALSVSEPRRNNEWTKGWDADEGGLAKEKKNADQDDQDGGTRRLGGVSQHYVCGEDQNAEAAWRRRK